MKPIKILFILGFCLLLVACASSDKLERLQKLPAQELFSGGEKALADSSYEDAIDHFETMETMYPANRDTRQAQLNIIYAYYADGDYPSAITAADRYIHLYPLSPHVDYAYYLHGVAQMEAGINFFERYFPLNRASRALDNYQQAFTNLNLLVTRFPNSSYTPDAHQRMIYIRNLIAKHKVEIAEYYYECKAYVAAANDAAEVALKYQNTPSVAKALTIMLRSYRQLGLTKLEQQSFKLLKANYPEAAKSIKLKS